MNQNKIDLEAGAPEMHLLVIHCLLDTGTYEGESTHMINEKPGIDCWLLEETVDQANPNALLFAVRETTVLTVSMITEGEALCQRQIDHVLGVWSMRSFQSRGLTENGPTLRYNGVGFVHMMRWGLEVNLEDQVVVWWPQLRILRNGLFTLMWAS